jgi:hypothetical protein
LLDEFAVYGHYYQARIGPELQAPLEALRSRLEIAPRAWSLSDVDAREADLLVIMMNPGASKPLGTLWDGDAPSGLVAAQPDRTQYQIMRLLRAAQALGLGWRHARVFNLSDLRTPESAEMIAKLRFVWGSAIATVCSQMPAERNVSAGLACLPPCFVRLGFASGLVRSGGARPESRCRTPLDGLVGGRPALSAPLAANPKICSISGCRLWRINLPCNACVKADSISKMASLHGKLA